jgi:hypothetical protein
VRQPPNHVGSSDLIGEILEIKLILCPIDFSELSIRAYRYALITGRALSSQVVVQHIVELGDLLPWALLPLRASMKNLTGHFARAARSNYSC